MTPRLRSTSVLGVLCAGLWFSGQMFYAQLPPPIPAIEPVWGRRAQIDRAIQSALVYLANRQAPAGSWDGGHLGPSPACTSLAIMAFLAAGHVPGEGPYATNIERGVQWVLEQQLANGLFADRHNGQMYTHGICALMLSEVLGMTPEANSQQIRQALERSIEVILVAQAVKKNRQNAGGWRYQPRSDDSDLSVTGWQLLALRAAKNVGCDVPAECIDQAVAYVKNCTSRNHDGFGYMGASNPTPVMTGTGILCLEICGAHHTAEALGGANFLFRRPLMQGERFFFYGVYYCTTGMFQIGGKHWEITRDHLEPLLMALQLPDGRWDPHGEEMMFGPVYGTSMAVLALAVEYQYLPIYQR
ncbi:MAG: Prenyltransferase/squalene oxidase [Planctomycetaceae bacterium]|nr:Prenyltransferase/squalene oxidase [Planctomycetaceae bacterium]